MWNHIKYQIDPDYDQITADIFWSRIILTKYSDFTFTEHHRMQNEKKNLIAKNE